MEGVCGVESQAMPPATPCAPPTDDVRGASGSCSGTGSNLNTFLSSWMSMIQPKFVPLLSSLSRTDAARNLLLCQIYTYLPVLTKGEQMLQSESTCLLGTQVLDGFHQLCHKAGVALDLIGPMGKVWENGDVQVVQYPANLPNNVYPMDRFPADAISLLGEIVFLPLYDSTPNSPTQGIVGVIELMLTKKATDDMVVATMISTIASILPDLGLSLSAPITKPSSCDSSSTMERTGSLVSNDSTWKTSDLENKGMSRRPSQRRLV